MKVLGLITEYNPFHNGHKYHLEKSKSITGASHTVVVMSGNFLQRGEPALFDKWIRAEMAVKEGIDLVIELPTVFACNSAEYFALGSIKILDSLNIVDYISFGSEVGNISKLKTLSDIFLKEPNDYVNLLKRNLSKGDTFPVARQKAIDGYLHSAELTNTLRNPNNILGIEYLKALKRLNSNIDPLTIKRVKSEYNSTEIHGNICSATAIRTHLKEQSRINELEKVMPTNSYKIFKESLLDGKGPVFLENFERIILYKLRSIPTDELKKIHDVNEGFDNRLKQGAIISNDFNNFLDYVKTKRYTLTRIQRILIKILLGITKEDIKLIANEKSPVYIRVLGFSKKGAELIKKIKKETDLPIVTNINKYSPNSIIERKMLDYDILGTNIYSLFIPNTNLRKGGWDYLQKPYIHFL